MKNQRSRIRAIAKKEFLHIIYDKRSLLIIIAMPLLMLILFGYALNMEIENIDTAIIDLIIRPCHETW